MSVKACTFFVKRFMALFVSVLLVVSLIPAYALAEPTGDADAPLTAQVTLPASGTSGTCTWEIDVDGNLVVRPINGASGELESSAPWEDYRSRIVTASFAPGVKASSSAREMFHGCTRLSFLDLSGLDTSAVTSMGDMFSGCSSLASLDLSGLDTSRVTDMGSMFRGCSSLASLDLSSFDTSKVTSMRSMFDGCSGLKQVRLGGKFDFRGTGTEPLVKLPGDMWLSVATGEAFTPLQIAETRNGIADTYVRETSGSDKPGEPEPGDPGIDDPEPDDPGTTNPEPSNPGTNPAPDKPGTSNPGTTNPEPVGTQAMYRLYNPNSGEHFYTASTVERDAVIAAGWNDEGIGWTAPTEGIRVYRLYNSFAGEHHYTTSAEERDMLVSVGWTWEEGGWFSDPDKAVPLYRAYNPNAYANNHHYTTDWGEFQTLLGLGWQDEGVGWHGVK